MIDLEQEGSPEVNFAGELEGEEGVLLAEQADCKERFLEAGREENWQVAEVEGSVVADGKANWNHARLAGEF